MREDYIPRRTQERRLRKDGAEFIVGLDEVGRGAWAGPLVAAAVAIPFKVSVKGVRDSKLLSEAQREEVAHAILLHAARWSYGVVHHEEIDAFGLTHANCLAFARALEGLKDTPTHVLVDGGYKFPLPFPCTFIKDGDHTEFLIAAASVLAKVFRDRLMRAAHILYPEYGFDQHKGYGTEEHQHRVRQFGLCRLHRKNYNFLNIVY